MRVESFTIADFYSNVDEVREFALKQEFSTVGNFPGRRTKSFLNESMKTTLQDILTPFAGKVTNWGDAYSGAFQYTISHDRSWIHSDSKTDWAGVIYLTPDAPVSAGTGIFRFKENGLRGWDKRNYSQEENDAAPQNIHHVDYTKWEMVDRIGNLYNRLIMYRGDLFHVSLDYFGTDITNGRLFQTFFFNTEK